MAAPTPTLHHRIEEALGEPDPVLCNLRITLAHGALAQALREITGLQAGANFHSWAVWGSKKAGVTIRQEDLERALRDATVVSGLVGAVVGVGAAAVTVAAAGWAPLASPAGAALLALGGLLGTFCGALAGRAIARHSRREAARLVLEGNRLVLDDIGRVTARFVETFPPGRPPTPEALDRFLDTLRPGPAPDGGQDLLRQAFRRYAEASTASDPARIHEAVYHGNLLAILHEHRKLQPFIRGSMPRVVRRCVTKRMLTFDIGSRALSVGDDVPSLDGVPVPPTLARLADPALLGFLEGGRDEPGWDRSGPDGRGSRARDWSRIEDRMGYIVHLFRRFHLDDAVHAAPYDAVRTAAIRAGQIPAGPL